RVTFQNGALQAAVVTDPAAPLEPVNFEAFRTMPSEEGRPTVLTFVPDGSGGVSGGRVSNIGFARVRPQRRASRRFLNTQPSPLKDTGSRSRAPHPRRSGRFSSVNTPPCASAICRHSTRPIPDPIGFVV